VAPTHVAQPRWLAFNTALALELGLDPQTVHSDAGLAILAGNELPIGAASIALAYAGHQFGHFVPQLGDGRAILLGEVVDCSGTRRDIQLKGAGPTPYSRRGDGRAAIGPVLREYLLSEAMFALGIPTTRALAAVATGEYIWRETATPGAILTRVANSHVRVGTFQFFAARDDQAALQQLSNYVIERHYPQVSAAPRPTLALLQAVAEAQAQLLAQWLQVGFIHGVMNTDNSSICGETLDYGPCAFLEAYNPQQVYSAIDRNGRYAFANQPLIAQWNLARLAETLLPLIDPDPDQALVLAEAVVNGFTARFDQHWRSGMHRKLGLLQTPDTDQTLLQDWLDALALDQVDYTLAFRMLGDALDDAPAWDACRALFADPTAVDAWHARWCAQLQRDPQTTEERRALMHSSNPAIIARNHQVQAALLAAQNGDLTPFDDLLAALRQPFSDNAVTRPYRAAALPHQQVCQTFCGT
jgi:uncharacterized protein YdiU (UPF0061 family)